MACTHTAEQSVLLIQKFDHNSSSNLLKVCTKERGQQLAKNVIQCRGNSSGSTFRRSKAYCQLLPMIILHLYHILTRSLPHTREHGPATPTHCQPSANDGPNENNNFFSPYLHEFALIQQMNGVLARISFRLCECACVCACVILRTEIPKAKLPRTEWRHNNHQHTHTQANKRKNKILLFQKCWSNEDCTSYLFCMLVICFKSICEAFEHIPHILWLQSILVYQPHISMCSFIVCV